MNNTEKIQLHKMINDNNVEDCTAEIRAKKHSIKISKDVEKLLNLKTKYSKLAKTNPEEFDNMCALQCTFIFTNYTDIYNKIKKDELNLQILQKLLIVLKYIEDEQIDQHEGAFEVGKILKEMYVDTALTRSKNLDIINNKIELNKPKNIDISWKDYKNIQK